MPRDDWKFTGHIWLNKAAVFGLSAIDLKVYSILLAHYNTVTRDCFPSIPVIAEEAGICQTTVKQSRNRLKKLGLINWQVNKKERNSCMYDLPLEFGAESEQARLKERLRVRSPDALPKKRSKKVRGKVTRRPEVRRPDASMSGHQTPPNKKKLINKKEQVHDYETSRVRSVDRPAHSSTDTSTDNVGEKIISKKEPFEHTRAFWLWRQAGIGGGTSDDIEYVKSQIRRKEKLSDTVIIKLIRRKYKHRLR